QKRRRGAGAHRQTAARGRRGRARPTDQERPSRPGGRGDDGVRDDRFGGRGDAPRRRGLPREAVRGRRDAHGAPARDRVPRAQGRKPRDPAAQPGAVHAQEHPRAEPGDAGRLRAAQHGCRARHDRADPRRDGRWQGAARALAPLLGRSARQAVRRGELRGDPGRAVRVGAVRLQEGRLHEASARRSKKTVRAISPAVMQALCRYAWPGNVRELENVIERAVIVAKGDTIADVERFLTGEAERPRVDLGLPFRDAKARVIEEFERAYIVGVLEAEGGKLTAAAKHADMDPKNFYEKLTRYGLRRPAGGLGD